jgi:hypothetical protein
MGRASQPLSNHSSCALTPLPALFSAPQTPRRHGHAGGGAAAAAAADAAAAGSSGRQQQTPQQQTRRGGQAERMSCRADVGMSRRHGDGPSFSCNILTLAKKAQDSRIAGAGEGNCGGTVTLGASRSAVGRYSGARTAHRPAAPRMQARGWRQPWHRRRNPGSGDRRQQRGCARGNGQADDVDLGVCCPVAPTTSCSAGPRRPPRRVELKQQEGLGHGWCVLLLSTCRLLWLLLLRLVLSLFRPHRLRLWHWLQGRLRHS